MNLRTLKKLCKRAAPLLPLLGDDREQFPAEPWRNYHHAFVGDRKHWDRSSVRADFKPHSRWSGRAGRSIVHVTREGRTVLIEPPTHPRKGTIMVGCVSGYYEPEWDEQCAWSALEDQVRTYFTDWNEEDPRPTRHFAGPGDILRAAHEMIELRRAEEATLSDVRPARRGTW